MNAVKNMRQLLDACVKRCKVHDDYLKTMFNMAKAAIEDPEVDCREVLIEIAHLIDPKYTVKIPHQRGLAVNKALGQLGNNRGPNSPTAPAATEDTGNNSEASTPGSGKERLL